ncbi:terminase small subunit [Christiangramia sp.]|uniref:terminase small subunit n=1 Tax=Christiangramia sp. TaxID=1931228 RepID=UPI00260CE267|nr:terminase small subunit [Christiangramia sp.]
MKKELTPKQEKFCQEYIITGSKSEAYRQAYNAENMKPETINVKACQMFEQDKIRLRVEELKQEVAKRNEITIDECVSKLAAMARFDIADLFDDNGSLLSIKDIPKETRLAIESIDMEELRVQGIKIGEIKKVKTSNRRANIIELMKYLGGYEKDNDQKSTVTVSFKD